MTDYTIARYEYNLGGGESHDFYALEQINPDGSHTRLAAIHGMATDAQGKPRPIGMPWDDDTIKAHLYTDQDPAALGLTKPNGVSVPVNGPDAGPAAGQPVGPNFLADTDSTTRRSDLGPMSRDQATALFQKQLDLGAEINDKDQPYSVFGTDSNTVAKHMGEVVGDPSIGSIDQQGQSPNEGNKPGWGERIVSPDEVRGVNPDATTLSYPPASPVDPNPVRSVVTHGDGSQDVHYQDGSVNHVKAPAGQSSDAAPDPAPSGDDIAAAARDVLGSGSWRTNAVNSPFGAGVQKDHQFVADTLDQAGLGFDGNPAKIPTAAQWADPDADIPGWTVVDGLPQAGDVLATPKGDTSQGWYIRPGQQMGIATGDGTTIGINANEKVAEGSWGLDGASQPTIRRSAGLIGDGSGADDSGSATDTTPVAAANDDDDTDDDASAWA